MTASDAPSLLLVNLGTPQAPTTASVRAFLAEFLGDPEVVDLPRWIWLPTLYGIVLRTRPKRVAEQYASIWSPAGSPLRVGTEAITARAATQASDHSVRCAYRYGAPSIDTMIRQMANETRGQIVVVPLFPQRTDATTGTVFRLARKVAARAGVGPRIVERAIPADDPGYIAALVERWREALAAAPTAPDHLVISYHGLPVRYDNREGHVYTGDCERTTTAFLAAAGWPRDRTTVAYQSKFGSEPWLTPATSDVIAELPARGVKHLAVIAPGFVTEGLETLEELGIRARETFVAAGGESFTYAGAVGDHPAFVQGLVNLAQR
ncbi:MAG TPA: ferrochelatase [Gemmatimonadales bacterium]|jgi:ferrochelatase